MEYKSLRDCVDDLEQTGQLIRVKSEIDPNLEMAEIHRRIFDAKGGAILFEKVKGSPFQAISNLYGTYERSEFLFRHTLKAVEKILELKLDPIRFLKNPLRYLGTPFTALNALPKKNNWTAPILYGNTQIDQLPQVKSWGMDGGAFVTLPQVYTEDPDKKGVMNSNLGMYRIQLSGNEYITNEEIGLHYQIHRGIGVHHEKYNRLNEPFRCSIFVGGPPSHALSAIFPLPEGLSELLFAGMLGGRRFRYIKRNNYTLSSDADFVITGIIQKNKKKPEGPFGDHLGYYSLEHDFPVMQVEKVYHRKNPLWHFTVVGRPPAEDSSFGHLIHQLVKPLTPQEFPGLVELHAVDAAGVHPLLLAIGKERYMPFREQKPEEILTIANRILGSGQTSLAKFLFIAAQDYNDKQLNTKDIRYFFHHLLERIDWSRDLHFQTNTTIDTLDYSGAGWNSGSKVVVACCGAPKRQLSNVLPTNFQLPQGFSTPRFVQHGILAIQAPAFTHTALGYAQANQIATHFFTAGIDMQAIPLILLVDDADFASKNTNNFVWNTFTRANPSHDIYGVGSFFEFKHWGCRGSLIIDARKKPHHAPELVTDPDVVKKVDSLFKNDEGLSRLNLV